MKAGWEEKRLGDICSFENGDRGTNYPSRSAQTRTGIPFINAGHLTDDGIKIRTLNYISRERFDLLGSGKIRPGDILFCLRGSLGKFASVGNMPEGAIASSLVIIRPRENVLNTYLLAYLQSDMCAGMIDRFKNGAAQPNLSSRSLSDFIIPVPPLPEQQRIVRILDQAFDAIATAKANTEKNLQNARALFDSHLQATFTQRHEGWIIKRIAEIATHSLGKMLDKSKNKGEPQHYLRNINVRWFDFDLSDLLKMRFLPEEAPKYTIRQGDVVVCEGGYPGRAAIWNHHDPIYFQKALHRVRFHDAQHNKWFVFYLYFQNNSGALRRYFTGTGIQHFTGEALARLRVPLPPQPELNYLVSQLEDASIQAERLKSFYRQKLAALDELKKSLLHQAFTGQL